MQALPPKLVGGNVQSKHNKEEHTWFFDDKESFKVHYSLNANIYCWINNSNNGFKCYKSTKNQ